MLLSQDEVKPRKQASMLSTPGKTYTIDFGPSEIYCSYTKCGSIFFKVARLSGVLRSLCTCLTEHVSFSGCGEK